MGFRYPQRLKNQLLKRMLAGEDINEIAADQRNHPTASTLRRWLDEYQFEQWYKCRQNAGTDSSYDNITKFDCYETESSHEYSFRSEFSYRSESSCYADCHTVSNKSFRIITIRSEIYSSSSFHSSSESVEPEYAESKCTELECSALECTKPKYPALECTKPKYPALECTEPECSKIDYSAFDRFESERNESEYCEPNKSIQTKSNTTPANTNSIPGSKRTKKANKLIAGSIILTSAVILAIIFAIFQIQSYKDEQQRLVNYYDSQIKYLDYVKQFYPDDTYKIAHIYSILQSLSTDKESQAILSEQSALCNIITSPERAINSLETCNNNFRNQYGLYFESCSPDIQLSCSDALNSLSANVCDLNHAFIADRIRIDELAAASAWPDVVKICNYHWQTHYDEFTLQNLVNCLEGLTVLNQHERAYSILSYTLFNRCNTQSPLLQDNLHFHKTAINIIEKNFESNKDIFKTIVLFQDLNKCGISTPRNQLYCDCLYQAAENEYSSARRSSAKTWLLEAKKSSCSSSKRKTLERQWAEIEKKESIAQKRAEEKSRLAQKEAERKRKIANERCERRKRQLAGRCCCLDHTIGSCGRGGCSWHGGITGWNFCLDGYCD